MLATWVANAGTDKLHVSVKMAANTEAFSIGKPREPTLGLVCELLIDHQHFLSAGMGETKGPGNR
jgi:hypothetical protein